MQHEKQMRENIFVTIEINVRMRTKRMPNMMKIPLDLTRMYVFRLCSHSIWRCEAEKLAYVVLCAKYSMGELLR